MIILGKIHLINKGEPIGCAETILDVTLNFNR